MTISGSRWREVGGWVMGVAKMVLFLVTAFIIIKGRGIYVDGSSKQPMIR